MFKVGDRVKVLGNTSVEDMDEYVGREMVVSKIPDPRTVYLKDCGGMFPWAWNLSDLELVGKKKKKKVVMMPTHFLKLKLASMTKYGEHDQFIYIDKLKKWISLIENGGVK